MIWNVWGQTLNPGNEQGNFWGSASADRQGSQNFAGIADPAIDTLIKQVVLAKDREEKNVATRALDRTLLAGHYVIPLYYASSVHIAYWDKFDRPASLPEYSVGFPDVWWSKSAAK